MFPSSSLVELFDFLSASPTAWHAVDAMATRLEAAGFTPLDESQAWSLEAGGRYYCVRGDGALVAFRLPADKLTSLRMIGAHTDSPALRLKPQPLHSGHGCCQLGVEVYGGALLAPWFDRDLGIAGRVYLRGENGRLERRLLHIDRPLAVIPSLAIHLDREANSSRSYNAQTQMAAVIALGDGEALSIEALIQRWLSERHGIEDAEVVDFELNLCDVQPPTQSGLDGELISSARLDNLLSCWCGMEALIAADGEQGALLIANDHEEIGSGTAGGAQGTLLNDVVARLAESQGEGSAEGRIRLLQRSRLVSCDNAHAVHPAWPDKHDAQHRPRLNGGPVIKVNASQRYATSAATGALFRDICRTAGVPVQPFVSRADMPCGSTIGPLSATRSGVPTLDIGIAQWAMHSIRETAGARDPAYLIGALTAFCNRAVLD